MSAQIKDGGPAFPCEQHETQDGLWNQTFESGMTLRDYFAAHAPAPPDWWIEGYPSSSLDEHGKLIAEWNWAYADAMLRAREVQS